MSRAAAAAVTADHVFLEAVLGNPLLRLDPKKWFDLVQDVGTDMTELEKSQYAGKPGKNKRDNIRHNDRFYAGIYRLSKTMVLLYRDRGGPRPGAEDEVFPRVGMSQGVFSTDVHRIGHLIIMRRKKVARADINSVTDSDFI